MHRVEGEAGVSAASLMTRPSRTLTSPTNLRRLPTRSPRSLAQQAAIAQIGQRALEERSQRSCSLDEACALVGERPGHRVCLHRRAGRRRSSRADRRRRGLAATGVVGELVLGTGAESQAGFTLASGEPVIVDDYGTEQRFRVVPALVESPFDRVCPCASADAMTPYGTLSVFTASASFHGDDANFLRAVANVLAAAVGRLSIETRAARVARPARGDRVDDRRGHHCARRTTAHLCQRRGSPADGIRQCRRAVNASRCRPRPVRDFDDNGQPMPPEDLPSRRAAERRGAAPRASSASGLAIGRHALVGRPGGCRPRRRRHSVARHQHLPRHHRRALAREAARVHGRRRRGPVEHPGHARSGTATGRSVRAAARRLLSPCRSSSPTARSSS